MKNTILFITIVTIFTIVSCGSSSTTVKKESSIEGTWELNFISFSKIAFEGLYPEKKPTIKFDLKENKFSGNNSCNSYFGTLTIDGKKISFKDTKLAMTMMACGGKGDTSFMSALEKTESYKISEDGQTLSFLMGDVEIMKFKKQ